MSGASSRGQERVAVPECVESPEGLEQEVQTVSTCTAVLTSERKKQTTIVLCEAMTHGAITWATRKAGVLMFLFFVPVTWCHDNGRQQVHCCTSGVKRPFLRDTKVPSRCSVRRELFLRSLQDRTRAAANLFAVTVASCHVHRVLRGVCFSFDARHDCLVCTALLANTNTSRGASGCACIYIFMSNWFALGWLCTAVRVSCSHTVGTAVAVLHRTLLLPPPPDTCVLPCPPLDPSPSRPYLFFSLPNSTPARRRRRERGPKNPRERRRAGARGGGREKGEVKARGKGKGEGNPAGRATTKTCRTRTATTAAGATTTTIAPSAGGLGAPETKHERRCLRTPHPGRAPWRSRCW